MTAELSQRGREAMVLFEAGASADEIAEHLFGDLRRAIEGGTNVPAEPESLDAPRGRSVGGALATVGAAFGTAVLVVLALTVLADTIR